MGISYNTSIVRDGLVLHLDAANSKSYPGSGNILYDLSGKENDALLINGMAVSDNTLYSDGIDDYATITYPLFTSPIELTIGGFFRHDSSGNGTYETVLHQSTDTSIGASAYWFGVDINNKLTATIGARTGVGWAAGQTTTTAVDGQWYYLVASWDGSTVYVYLNGEQVKSYALSTYTDPGTSTRLCASGDATGYLYKGNVGLVHMYTKYLSASEVKQNFNALKTRYGL